MAVNPEILWHKQGILDVHVTSGIFLGSEDESPNSGSDYIIAKCLISTIIKIDFIGNREIKRSSKQSSKLQNLYFIDINLCML